MINLIKRNMRRELMFFTLIFSLTSALLYTFFLDYYFIKGIDESIRIALVVEARELEKRYNKNPNTPLLKIGSIKMYLGTWDDLPSLYKETMSPSDIDHDNFIGIELFTEDDTDYEFNSEARYITLYRHPLPSNEYLYVISDISEGSLKESDFNRFEQLFNRMFYIAAGYIFIMLVLVWLYNRRVANVTGKLASWAETLKLEDIKQDRPDFYYTELNRISDQILISMQRTATLLEKEHHFLRNASHELRTPIAVIRANIDLLNKIGITDRQTNAIQRVGRASQSMQQLTETILWLSRDGDNNSEQETKSLRIKDLLESSINDLDYLLQGKDIRLKRIYNDTLSEKKLPETAMQIILNNLVRNAFQHSQQGIISIGLSDTSLFIENEYDESDKPAEEQGYGLGLILVKQICDQLGWNIEYQQSEGMIRVELHILG